MRFVLFKVVAREHHDSIHIGHTEQPRDQRLGKGSDASSE